VEEYETSCAASVLVKCILRRWGLYYSTSPGRQRVRGAADDTTKGLLKINLMAPEARVELHLVEALEVETEGDSREEKNL
jgi:hypothetical protein